MLAKTYWTMSGVTMGILLSWVLVTLPGSYASLVGGVDSKELQFTEEREAAALHFVKKHVPELVPLLEQLKRNNQAQYQREICAIFQVTEWLADLRDDDRRHNLELKIWIAENKANALITQLSTPLEEDRKRVEEGLQNLAKELVELEIQVLELKAEQLEKELSEVKDELGKTRETSDKKIKERYESLLDKAKIARTKST
jgi:hypothetical protein